MIHINIICVGKIKEKYLKDAIQEYSKRLSKYCKLSIIEIPDESIPDNVNDKMMIENAGLGIAMGNSAPYIKEIADKVVANNNEDGVAEAVEMSIE